MNLFQILLIMLSTVLLTLGIFYLFQSIFVVKKIEKYFYFAMAAIGGFIFIFSQYLLAVPGLEESTYLLFHRVKWFGFFTAIAFWYICVNSICFEKIFLAKVFLIYNIINILVLPTNYFLSLPVKHISINLSGVTFDYQFGTSRVFYKTYMFLLLVVYIVFVFRTFINKLSFNKKLFAYAVLLQLLAAINDYLVMYGFIKNILLTEYFSFFFVIVIFIYFILEDKQKHEVLSDTNHHLKQEVKRKTSELNRINKKLFKMATYDPLTGLFNRQIILDRLEEEKNRIDRYFNTKSKNFVIYFIDLDNFKYYNDTFGHHVGDFILKLFSNFIKDSIRKTDICARYGGDEFIVLLTNTGIKGAKILIKRMYKKLEELDYFKKEIKRFLKIKNKTEFKKKVTFSTGIAEYDKGSNVDNMLKLADSALYHVKNNNKSDFKVWNES